MWDGTPIGGPACFPISPRSPDRRLATLHLIRSSSHIPLHFELVSVLLSPCKIPMNENKYLYIYRPRLEILQCILS